MNNSWNRINEAFQQAMLLPKEERCRYVRDSFCGDQDEVEQLIRLLQKAQDEAEGRLAGPASVNVRHFLQDSQSDIISDVSELSHPSSIATLVLIG